MINVYVLHNDTPKSLQYLADCKRSLDSLDKSGKFNLIPVLGYMEPDALSLYEKEQIPVIPYYKMLLEHQGLTEEARREINGAMCATLGHVKIWKLIAESEAPGIVLEHDAIFKSTDFDLPRFDNNEILWLGPRVCRESDYEVPADTPFELHGVLRFEGVHAYAVSAETAGRLHGRFLRKGFMDSIDGFLAMRNFYKFPMRVMDPPPIVAVVNRDGNFSSSIESTSATWNSKNFPGFLKGLKVTPPPERIVEYDVTDFHLELTRLSPLPEDPKIFAITNDDGTAITQLSNYLFSHESDCRLDYACPQEKQVSNSFKSYFSNYYYKISNIGHVSSDYNLVRDMVRKFDFSQYDLVYFDCFHLDSIDCLYNCLSLMAVVDKVIIKCDFQKAPWTKVALRDLNIFFSHGNYLISIN
jgi:hypothetical protein